METVTVASGQSDMWEQEIRSSNEMMDPTDTERLWGNSPLWLELIHV
jgi:hypothetical protein